ncbi:MAG: hypothetical protein OXI44_06465 [Bacteroidota bacterium]|nr:hypothetical protein [Bacteroidota bacterium]
MTKQRSNGPDKPKDRLDRMMDEPSVNERYGGMTMREMVRKVVLRRDDSAQEKKKINLK